MCIAIAAPVAAGISAIGTIAGMASSVFGIMQSQQQQQFAQQQAAMQQQQAIQNMDLQYQQAQRQVAQENQARANKYQGEVRMQQAQKLSYYQQLTNNNEALNKSYTQEQVKLNEAKDAAAFKAQANYAKAIGAKGKILAGGMSGQSIGLLALDVDRQKGFNDAQENASIRSAEAQAAIGMDSAYTQAKSANNQAYSKLTPNVQAPLMAPKPLGIGKDLNLGIPTYSWS